MMVVSVGVVGGWREQGGAYIFSQFSQLRLRTFTLLLPVVAVVVVLVDAVTEAESSDWPVDPIEAVEAWRRTVLPPPTAPPAVLPLRSGGPLPGLAALSSLREPDLLSCCPPVVLLLVPVASTPYVDTWADCNRDSESQFFTLLVRLSRLARGCGEEHTIPYGGIGGGGGIPIDVRVLAAGEDGGAEPLLLLPLAVPLLPAADTGIEEERDFSSDGVSLLPPPSGRWTGAVGVVGVGVAEKLRPVGGFGAAEPFVPGSGIFDGRRRGVSGGCCCCCCWGGV
uniref:Uncharacterized protein n=1 Tax=Anopheles merus TaxID=30066 RepID=A0A182V1Q9_ANOME